MVCGVFLNIFLWVFLRFLIWCDVGLGYDSFLFYLGLLLFRFISGVGVF